MTKVSNYRLICICMVMIQLGLGMSYVDTKSLFIGVMFILSIIQNILILKDILKDRTLKQSKNKCGEESER